MLRKLFSSVVVAAALSFGAYAQSGIASDFKETCDSLTTLLKERTTVRSILRLKSVTNRGGKLDFHFNENLADYPWHKNDVKWFREELRNLFPEGYEKYSVGKIFCKTLSLEELVTPELTSSGDNSKTEYRISRKKVTPLVSRTDGIGFKKGLAGKHIALWQSHGRYYEAKTRRWEWQRALDFMTVEDLYTQSYVLPYLIPMLENAGAYVMTPRERDTQKLEVVCDNDPSFRDDRNDPLLRRHGNYRETGSWDDAGEGFADLKKVYIGIDNPFRMGSVRFAACNAKEVSATAKWLPEFTERGEYAVYVSYKTLENSTSKARYTVNHMGGTSTFSVNQTMGGGTWIYLGTFEFDTEGDWSVTLDNFGEKGKVVTADAVRFGGGMGKVARGNDDEPMEYWTTSGMPAYLEGALYNMQYSGIDTTITRAFETDYTNDYADRGAWVTMLAGGSEANPKDEGLNIPFDLSLAFHSDAGQTPDDSYIGTLAIYTLKCDDSRKYPDGSDRMAAREYTDLVQTQIAQDVRALHEPQWARRQLWDRSYSESRTTSVPGMLLEILAHSNFADMKYGHDPNFRFTVSRAVYKGMLKFLANRYGKDYVVQPLAVNSFSAVFAGENRVKLSWKPTEDTLEPTAKPTGYLIYMRIDDGGWKESFRMDKPAVVNGKVSAEISIEAGHIYAFKVCAYNDGGLSFPSEILAAGTPEGASDSETVLVVNNFDRVSAPAWFDTPTYAGFDGTLDSGVPYIKDITRTGRMYEFNRQRPWEDDDNPGFGGSFADEAGLQVAGNTFDYPYIHGQSLMALGRRFCSVSSAAFQADGAPSYVKVADIICGKQVTVSSGRPGALPDKYQVFPEALRSSIRKFTSAGGDVLVSGSNIGTDIWSKVYPVQQDSLNREDTKKFAQEVLGYKWIANYASKTAVAAPMRNKLINDMPEDLRVSFYNEPNEKIYCVETPDGLLPFSDKSAIIMRYTDTHIGAGIAYNAGGWQVVSFGFPIEVVKCEKQRTELMRVALDFFKQK
ncbi:MAG: xanthan lyase [Bacteroidales bacterium]|nr:xanthan lyase [Bacteroidales bacterium]